MFLRKTQKFFVKILKNKKLTYIFSILVIFLIIEIINNPEDKIIKFLNLVLNNFYIKILFFIGILCLMSINQPLAFIITLTYLFILISNKLKIVEGFQNKVTDLVDRNKILKYNKNLKNPKKLTSKEEVKKQEIDFKDNEKIKEDIEMTKDENI